AHGAMVRIAGPLLDEAGAMIGSLILVQTDRIETARAFNAADPYTLAGLFERVEIRAWRPNPAP
ncbi:MAG: YciI family protein, partial [Caulobacteraceae bacterium]